MKRSFLILVLLLSLSMLFSCGQDSSGDSALPEENPDASQGGADKAPEDDDREEFTVKIRTDDTFSVDGDNELSVKDGDSCSFKLIFADNYKFANSTAGKFKDGVLTIESVTKDLTVRVYTETINPIRTFEVFNNDDFGSVTSSLEGTKAMENATVALVATPEVSGSFIGWTVGDTFVNGAEIVSSSLTFDVKVNGNMKIYTNYLGDGVKLVEYNLNGGYHKDFPDQNVYLSYHNTKNIDNPNLISSRNILIYEGHTLLGFSTNADGSGDFYTPGSIANVPERQKLTLYAQWSRWSDSNNFTTVKTADGLAITGYSGDEPTLSIPALINDTPVVSIEASAINSAPFDTLIIPYTVKSIKDGAFVGCVNFDKLYITDYFDSINDEAFTDCRAYTKFYLGAYRNPKFVNTSESVAYRLNTLYTRESNKKMIIVLGGSNVMHGFKAELLDSKVPATYDVLNFGTNMNNSGMLFLDAIKPFLKSGDIMVHAPEYGEASEQFGGYTITNRLYRAIESCYTILSYVDASKYTGKLSALSSFNNEFKQDDSNETYDKPITASTFPWCDMARETQCEIPAGTTGLGSIGADKIPVEKAEAVNAIAKEYEDAGITFLFSYAPIFNCADVTDDLLSAMDARYRELLSCPVISDPADYVFDEIYYFDSNYHLTTQGAYRRTDLLYNDIRDYLK